MIQPTIGHYEILGKLGEGGMGEVYLARDSRLNRQVALKLLSPALAASPESRLRFIREAQSASALNSPNIVTVYESGKDGETDFIAMEYVKGETLASVLRRGPLPSDAALAYALQIASALETAHNASIVHRDLKPGNLMVGPEGTLKVLDFGLAKAVAPDTAGPESAGHETRTTPLTQLGIAIGTLAYMSPEQALGAPLDVRSDIFSFGAVLYEMLSGKAPFAAATAADSFRRLQLDEPEPLASRQPGVPAELERIVHKALAKKPEDRYQSAAAMKADLKRFAGVPESSTGLATGSFLAEGPRLAGWFGRFTKRQVAAGLGAAAALAAILLWHPWTGSGHTPGASAQRWFDRGIAAIRDGTYHTASLALERAVSEDPDFALARIRLADSYFELDALDKAKEELLRAVPQDSDLSQTEELYLQAVRLTLTADFEGAARVYARIRNSVPSADRPSALVDYGRALEKAENVKGAAAAYEEAARLQPHYPSAFLRLGILHRRRLDQTQAGESFSRAEGLFRSLGNVEGLAEVNYQRGVLLNNLGNWREAKAILDQALAMAKTAASEPQQIAILLQLSGVIHRLEASGTAGDYAQQAIDLARARGLEPLAARGLIDLGNAYFVAGDAAQAKSCFMQALETARRNKSRRTESRALLSLGSLNIQQGEFQEGVKNVDFALAFYGQGGYRKEASQGLLLSGRARRSMGDYEGARKSFEEQRRRALEVGDLEQLALSQEGLGSVSLLQGRYPDALKHFQAALSAGSGQGNPLNTAYTRLNLASAHWRLGRYAEAERIINEIGALDAAKSNRALRSFLAQSHLAMALSRRQFSPVSALAARQLSEADLSPQAKAETLTMLALAQAQSGSAGLAIQSAQTAARLASASSLPDLLSSALAAQAAALSAAGRHREALEIAGEAVAKAPQGNHDRQWRTNLLAARAAAAAGRHDEAAGYAARSAQSLAEVQQLFGPSDFASYAKRPDIQHDVAAMNALRKPATTLVRVKGPTR